MPIFSPPTSNTLDLTNKGGERGHFSSWLTFRFDATMVKFTLLRNDTRFSTPSSNSWFPNVWWREEGKKVIYIKVWINTTWIELESRFRVVFARVLKFTRRREMDMKAMFPMYSFCSSFWELLNCLHNNPKLYLVIGKHLKQVLMKIIFHPHPPRVYVVIQRLLRAVLHYEFGVQSEGLSLERVDA